MRTDGKGEEERGREAGAIIIKIRGEDEGDND